jgi:hypothetical protein
VFGLEDGVADELAGVLVFQPVENARSACLVVTMRPRRIFARCWDTAAGDLWTISASRLFTVAQGKDDPDPGGVGEHGKHLHGQFHVLAVRFTTTYAFICIHTQVISQSPAVSEHCPHRPSRLDPLPAARPGSRSFP